MPIDQAIVAFALAVGLLTIVPGVDEATLLFHAGSRARRPPSRDGRPRQEEGAQWRMAWA
jgi:hypothetical protein